MNFLSNIGYDTVFYAIFAIVGISVIIWAPQIILYLLIPTTILPKYFNQAIAIGHVNIYIHDLLLLFYCSCAGFLIFERFIKKKKIFNIDNATKPLFYLVSCYLLLHLIYLSISFLQGVGPATAIRRFLIYSDILYFYFPILFLSDEKQYKNLLKFMIIMAMLGFLHQIYVAAVATRFHNFTSSGTVRIGLKGISIIGSSFFAFIVYKNNLKYYLVSICPVLSIFLVGHRSGFIALGASLIVFFFFTKKLTKILLLCYLFSALLLLSLAGLEFFTGHDFIGDTMTRTGDTFDVTNKTSIGRLNKIQDSFLIFSQNPIFGIGHNYESIKRLIKTKLSPHGLYDTEYFEVIEYNTLHPHSILFRSLSHTGIFGTLVLSSIVIIVLRRCKFLIRSKGLKSTNGIFIYCSVIFFVVFSFFNTTFTEEGWFFWILCGSIIFLTRDVKTETIGEEAAVNIL